MSQKPVSRLRRIAFVGSYLPRQCGIATFTTDLCEAIAAETSAAACFAVAVTDREDGYDYPDRVRLEMMQDDLHTYRRAADFLNLSDVDTVCLQHEYGIYGGRAGSHLLTLLRRLRMPVVTTLHTVLSRPDRLQRELLEEIARLSERVVVMSQHSLEHLRTVYHVPAEKVDFVPHGIPDVPFVDPNFYKDKFGVEGCMVLLTFGLLSPNKGIENMIRALPQVLALHPNVVYIVLGATHPHVRREQGERYRETLQQLARDLGVGEQVRFVDRFVSLDELVEYIGAADLYVTPYLNPEQSVSGTLAYTVGAGKAVISTPYGYAQELLGQERGLLVPFADPSSLARRVLYLLDHEAERHAMRKRAYLLGREMTWSQVAGAYLEIFERAREERLYRPRTVLASARRGQGAPALPALNLQHVWRLTDETGLLQHAVYSVPNYSEGYTTDDNARGLMLDVLLEKSGENWAGEARLTAPRYLAFLWHAFNPEAGRFRNFMGYDRRWLEAVGSADSHGRALHSLGLVLGRSDQEELHGVALRLFEAAAPASLELDGARSQAYALLGLHEYLRRFSGDRLAHQTLSTLAVKLLDSYQAHASQEWPWFEDALTYCNAVLPQALLAGGERLGRPDMVELSLEALRWLVNLQRSELGHFAPVGSNGFYPRAGEKARFDQQPVEAQSLVTACLEAWRLTADVEWYRTAEWACEWFLGRNDLGTPLYDPATGGCYDGLHPDRVNMNQGAESTLACLLALVEVRQAQRLLPPSMTAASSAARMTLETPAPLSKS